MRHLYIGEIYYFLFCNIKVSKLKAEYSNDKMKTKTLHKISPNIRKVRLEEI